MERTDVLRALTAARNAFNAELLKRGIHIGSRGFGDVLLYTVDERGLKESHVGEISYKQDVYSDEKRRKLTWRNS